VLLPLLLLLLLLLRPLLQLEPDTQVQELQLLVHDAAAQVGRRRPRWSCCGAGAARTRRAARLLLLLLLGRSPHARQGQQSLPV
jgi:hypothetical protein